MLLRKMLRDMRLHKTQFISVFLMAFLGTFIYAGIGGEWHGLRNNVDTYYRTTNLADVWLYGSNLSDRDEKAIESVSGIAGAERRLMLNTTVEADGNPEIALYFVKENKISKAYIVSGEEFSTDKAGVWIGDRYAKARHLKIGDQIKFNYNGMLIVEEIKGTVYSPEYVFQSDGDSMTPDFSQSGYAYISYKRFPYPNKLIYNQMLLKTAGDEDRSLEDKVNHAANGNFSVFLKRDNHQSVSMFDQEIKQHKAMGQIFPVAFLAIALLTMLTTMTRIVNNQRIQIGTLKALGFKKRKVLLHYIAYGFWLSLIGGLLGAILGPLTLPKLFFPSMSGFYTLPKWNYAVNISFYGMVLITVFLSALVTYLACRNVLKDTPAQTLRPKAPRKLKHVMLERTAIWEKVGVNIKWNLRDITRNKVRSLMTIVGVLGCTALIVCAFGMNDDMKDLKDWQYKDINHFASKLTLKEDITQGQINEILKLTNGESMMEGAVEVKANGNKKTGAITVTDHVTLMRNTDKNRNFIELPEKGVSISYKLANQLGVKKGDEISWHIFSDEKWATTIIADIYRTPSSQGITMTREYFETLNYTYRATAILTPKKVMEMLNGTSNIMHTQDLIDGWDDLTSAMMTMVYVLIAAAAILAIVVLYNLGILSFTEMERELATLKVIGLKTKKLRNLLLTQNLWLSMIGFVLGVPFGKLLVDVMISMMGDSFDMTNNIHLTNLIGTISIVYALAIFVNRLFSTRLRKIDLVSALKSVE